MQETTWDKKSGFKDLICGRSFWKKVIVRRESNKKVSVVLENRSDLDGPRAAGVTLAALLRFYNMNVDKLPNKVFVKSITGFKDAALLVFRCFSEIEKRHKFTKSFRNGKNVLLIATDGCKNWKEYENKVSRQMAVLHPGYSQQKIKGIRADGIMRNKQGNIVIYETKKKTLDLAEGLAQLIQYFCQIELMPEFKDARILSYLVSPIDTSESTLNFKKGLNFINSNVSIDFKID
jgi:hypothetical protein